jgi:hypothetical protein
MRYFFDHRGAPKIPAVLAVLAILTCSWYAGGCYDAKSPNLPPCPPNAQWPDPCADMPAPAKARDAGK